MVILKEVGCRRLKLLTWSGQVSCLYIVCYSLTKTTRMSTNYTQWFKDELDRVLLEMKDILSFTSLRIISFLKEIARPVYITLIVMGLVLYFTHMSRRLGKDLVKGGIALMVFFEILLPLISNLL